jgi:hypothetical protein
MTHLYKHNTHKEATNFQFLFCSRSISRKPTMKPPPPPVSSAIATLSGKPVHNTITASNSSSNYTSDHNASCNIYQSLSSPESPPPPNNLTSTVPVQKSTFVRKGSGFYGKDRRSTPRYGKNWFHVVSNFSIPKIPPPSPPKCPMIRSYHDDERFDELYEDIEVNYKGFFITFKCSVDRGYRHYSPFQMESEKS